MATGGFKLSLAGAKGNFITKKSFKQVAERRRFALGDDEAEDTTAKQEITGWDAAEGGAVDANTAKEAPKGPRVIAAQPNRNWREEARKRLQGENGATSAENGNREQAQKMGEPKLAFGLTTFSKKDAEDKPEPMDIDSEPKPGDTRTEDEKLQAAALNALVNGKAADFTVIPAISEEEAFQNDIRDAPSAPTLAAYEATPIEGFGAALLRGMGWKDGESLRKDKRPLPPPKEIKRRPALLGIGAKPESAAGVELGTWGEANKGKKKIAVQYNPLTLRNKKTGETLTEEELKQRLEKQKEEDEKTARNNTFVGDNDVGDARRREKRGEKKEKDKRDDSYDSDRRKEKGRRDRDDDYEDRKHRRDKKYSEYEDSDRDRQREKRNRDNDYDDRRRNNHREKDSRRRDRSRSPYDDVRWEKRRERDRREKSVDSEDRRRERRRDRERRDRDRSRSRDSDNRHKRSRDYDDDRRSRFKDDKYSRR